MADPKALPRRRFQFSLRTLMIGVTLFAILCAYVGGQYQIVRERKAYFDVHDDIMVSVAPAGPSLPWLRQQLGDKGYHAIYLPAASSKNRRAETAALFPEAHIRAYYDKMVTGARLCWFFDQFPDEREASGDPLPQK